jgi:hypothetical protein
MTPKQTSAANVIAASYHQGPLRPLLRASGHDGMEQKVVDVLASALPARVDLKVFPMWVIPGRTRLPHGDRMVIDGVPIMKAEGTALRHHQRAYSSLTGGDSCGDLVDEHHRLAKSARTKALMISLRAAPSRAGAASPRRPRCRPALAWLLLPAEGYCPPSTTSVRRADRPTASREWADRHRRDSIGA